MKMSLRILAGISGMAMVSSHGALIAFWDFNDGFDVPDGTPQIVHTAASGTGELYQQRADTDGNGKVGTVFVDPTLGINAEEGKTMAWDDVSKTGDNDAEFFISLPTVGFTDIEVSMDIKGNPGAGIVSFDLKYSLTALQDVTNPGDVIGTIKDFDGGISIEIFNNQPVTTTDLGFIRAVVDLSSLDSLEDQGILVLRFDDWKENDALSIDNVLVTGTPMPEPGAATLGLISLVALQRRRRR